MFNKLVGRVMGMARKNRWMFIPAVICLFLLFGINTVVQAVSGFRKEGTKKGEAGKNPAVWQKQYGVFGPVVLLCCCVAVIAVTVLMPPVPSVRNIVSSSGVTVRQPKNEGLSSGSALNVGSPDSEKGEPEPMPHDREHSDGTVNVPESTADKTKAVQDELLTTVIKYVGMLQANEVTADWGPDLMGDGPESENFSYYSAAWEAYVGLAEENRMKLEVELLDYLLTCHETVTGQ